jgi:hypothetical protein
MSNMRIQSTRYLITGILFFAVGCGSEASSEAPSSDTGNADSPPVQAATESASPIEIPDQGGGIIVIGDTSYPVVADWSCNFMSYADILGATGHGVDDESIEFAFDLTLQSSGAIAGQITLKLTEQDIRWETADAGGDETASGITEATLEEDGGFGKATFRQRGSGDREASSGYVEGSFDIRCPAK